MGDTAGEALGSAVTRKKGFTTQPTSTTTVQPYSISFSPRPSFYHLSSSDQFPSQRSKGFQRVSSLPSGPFALGCSSEKHHGRKDDGNDVQSPGLYEERREASSRVVFVF